jgi:hypothetical protein
MIDDRSTFGVTTGYHPAICTSFQTVEKDAYAVIVLTFSLERCFFE